MTTAPPSVRASATIRARPDAGATTELHHVPGRDQDERAARRRRRIEEALAHSDALPDYAAAALCGVSRATFWRRVKDGTFPKGFKIGGATRWRRALLEAALNRASGGAA